ncbi:MAG: GNAT family N-acetyltransferase [Solirubrobacteraceae bacterium]
MGDDDGVHLRRWLVGDAEVLARLVLESREHLRPWMGWATDDPIRLDERRKLLMGWESDWRAGGDVVLGTFWGDVPVGGCGLHRRIGPRGLEIGYWTHPGYLRRGMATSAARLLVGAAFSLPQITHVEIHHDKANAASAGVPRNLGFELIDERPDQPEAFAEVGIECRWRMLRDRWAHA